MATSSKGEFSNAKEYTYDVHIVHILALRRFTKTNLINFVKTQGLLQDTNSVLDEKKWRAAHERVAEQTPRSHGTFTIKQKFWDTINPEDYPYSDESRKLAYYNIARQASNNPQKPKIQRGEFFKKPSAPSSKENAEEDNTLQAESSQKRSIPDIKETNISIKRQKISESSQIYQPLIANKPSESRQVLAVTNSDPLSTTSTQLSISSKDPNKESTNDGLLNAITPDNSLTLPNNSPDIPSETYISRKPSQINPVTGRRITYAKRGGGSLRDRSSTGRKAPSQGSDHGSTSSKSDHDLNSPKLADSPQQIQATSTQPFTTPQTKKDSEIEGQKSDIETMNYTPQAQSVMVNPEGLSSIYDVKRKIQTVLNSTQRDLKAKEEQCQGLRSDLEKALGELTGAGEQIKTLDAQILELQGKLNDANATIVKWVDEDEKRVRARKELMML